MRWKVVLVIGSLAPLCGCTTLKLAGHNLVHEPVQYEDECRIKRRLRADGEKLWATIACAYPGRTFSREFRAGFLDGYVDYLDSGGTAGPPLIPPTEYRRSKYFCPEGQALVRDYFAGFKYGAEVACASGLRQFLTVPVLIPIQPPTAPLQITVDDGTVPGVPAPPPLPSELPATRLPGDKPPGDPLGPPKPVPSAVPVPTPVPVPRGPDGGASLPRGDVPAGRPVVPSGPRVPVDDKVRPAAAFEPAGPVDASAGRPPADERAGSFGGRPVAEPPAPARAVPEPPPG